MLRHFEACHPKPGMECVVAGGIAKVRIGVTSVLAGKLAPGSAGGKLFIVASLQPDGEIVVLNWVHSSEGLCILREDAITELGNLATTPAFADDLRAAVRRFPCKPD